ncbi:hypothetical protein [Microbulbifer pacificus]|uniref:Uncharacterized protein n=1 Tax=Microbulbifer pacificus TaxID=407164 RepID=A0AAU0MU27_9GAMM|nr:hypothetical protein [Microbulbifer pacificus]WOX03923.1 hypothetical protein R5R33_09225 [Microbulbifer pacificus]
MKPRLYPAVSLAAVMAAGARAEDQAMEHVEVIGYPTPQVAERASDSEKLAAKQAEQYREELLQLLREAQRKRLQALRLEGVTSNKETLAEETPAEQQQQLAPVGVETEPVKLEQPLRLEQKAGEVQPARKSEGEQSQQEPS